MSKVTTLCEQCGQAMSYYPSSFAPTGIKRFCSRKCQKDYTRIWTQCPVCQKRFWFHKSWPRIHCSRKCSAKTNGLNNLGKYGQGKSLTIACDFCGKNFERNEASLKNTRHHFCGRQCFGKWLAQTKKGKPRPEIQKPRPNRRKRDTLVCPQCQQSFEVKHSQSTRRRFCSKVCHTQWQRANSHLISGKNNFNYKGGHQPYYGPSWLPQRRKVRQRDNYTCQGCGISETELGRELDVHHIKPFRDFGVENHEQANKVSNLICYCNICHLKAEHT